MHLGVKYINANVTTIEAACAAEFRAGNYNRYTVDPRIVECEACKASTAFVQACIDLDSSSSIADFVSRKWHEITVKEQ